MNIKIEQLNDSEESFNKLLPYLYEVDELFHIPLRKQGRIEDSAKKWLTKAIVLIAIDVDADRICGSMIAYANDRENHYAFTAIKVVSEAYQRKGIMKLLRVKMCCLAKEAGMTVLRGNIHEANTASINDILQAGGKQIGYIDDKDNINYGDMLFEMQL